MTLQRGTFSQEKENPLFLIIQNDPHCPEGACSSILDALGEPFRVSAAFGGCDFPDPGSLTGVIVLGGEMSVFQTERFPHLDAVKAFMLQALGQETPLLGICLGGQLLAQVAGGAVWSPSPHGEHGISSVEIIASAAGDPLFHGVPTPFLTFQLHNDSFTPPPGALLLARSQACPAQAFRVGHHAYGVQFHPEVDRAIVAAWDTLSTPQTNFFGGFLAAERPFNAASRRIISNFVSLARRLRRS